MFKPNIGRLDRIVRIVAGVILIALGVLTPGAMWVAYAGLVPLFSGVFGICLAVCAANCCCKKLDKTASGAETVKSCGCGSGGCGSEAPPPAA